MTVDNSHPEQDPAEGSREKIEKELLKSRDPQESPDADKRTPRSQPGAEAVEPSPER